MKWLYVHLALFFGCLSHKTKHEGHSILCALFYVLIGFSLQQVNRSMVWLCLRSWIFGFSICRLG